MAYTTIDDPSAYFQTALWTGDNGNLSVTNDGNSDLKPDWIWAKRRDFSSNHVLADSTRGGDAHLRSNLSDAESQFGGLDFTFATDGFTSSGSTLNESSRTFVAWQWKANGGTTASNTDGSITSTVQADTTAGFSIVSYTGTGANATVGHGLGSAPRIIIIKDRDNGATNWAVYNESAGNNGRLLLNTTGDFGTSSTYWQDTSPTSSVFSLGTWVRVNQSSTNFIAYCFSEVPGYSSIKSYTGNGNADGPFIYTGFKPAFVMIKSTASAQVWSIRDNKRDSFNSAQKAIYANDDGAESDNVNNSIDLLSNGFKLRNQFGTENTSGEKFIYLAFASSPFVSSEGVPTTAF